MDPATWRLLADSVLALHAAVVVFVVAGLPAIVLGSARGWAWVRRPWLRVAHLVAIGVVVLQAWLGQVCGLTLLESWLRARAGQAGYGLGFIAHWVQRWLYHDAPWWLFVVAYTVFGALVAWAWWRHPPGRGIAPGGGRHSGPACPSNRK